MESWGLEGCRGCWAHVERAPAAHCLPTVETLRGQISCGPGLHSLTHSSWLLRVAGKELLSTCPWLAPTAILSTWLAETLFISGHQDRGISPTPFHTAGSAWSWANRGKTRLSPLLRGLQL